MEERPLYFRCKGAMIPGICVVLVETKKIKMIKSFFLLETFETFVLLSSNGLSFQ